MSILTVGELKKYLQDIPDDTYFGFLSFGHKSVEVFSPKRFLYLKSLPLGYGKNLFVCNTMGTHYNDKIASKSKTEYLGFVDDSDFKLHLKEK